MDTRTHTTARHGANRTTVRNCVVARSFSHELQKDSSDAVAACRNLHSVRCTQNEVQVMNTAAKAGLSGKGFLRTAAFFAAALLATTTAQAEVQYAVHQAPADTIPYTHLIDFTSVDGQTKEDFLLTTVAPWLEAYGKTTGLEGCAVIAHDAQSNRWSVEIGTNQSHVACLDYSDKVLPGYTATAETIHDHGRVGPIRLTLVDDELSLGRRMRAYAAPAVVEHFSVPDMQGDPGYLVTPHGLLYQHGEGTEVTVLPAASTALAAR